MRRPPAFALLVLGTLFASLSHAAPRIDTVAGTGQATDVGQPFGVEFSPDGRLHICEVETHRIRALDPKTGKLSAVVGTGKKGDAGDGGKAVDAWVDEPYEVRFDPAGNLYFVDMKCHRVRKVDAKTGLISAVAGTGEAGFAGDGGDAAKARFNQPHSIALDGQGCLYVADILNHRVRRVRLDTGVIDTIAGNGEKKPPAEGPAAGKPMLGPRALAVSGRTLWIALREGNSVWTLDLDTHQLRRIAGTGKAGYGGDGGDPKQALFNGPKGIALGADGRVYVADTENQAIRVLNPKANTLATLAGAGPKARGYAGDGGDPKQAKLDRPHGVGVGPDGKVYVGDSNNHRVRRVTE